MTREQQIDNALNRLNKRLQRAFNSLGPDSKTYTDLVVYTTGHLAARGATIKMTSSGVPQVSRGKSSIKALINTNIDTSINRWLDAHKTTAEVVKDIRTKLKSLGAKRVTKQMIQARAAAEKQAQDDVHRNIALLYQYKGQADYIDDVITKWQKGSGRKSYEDMVELSKTAEQAQKDASEGKLKYIPANPFNATPGEWGGFE